MLSSVSSIFTSNKLEDDIKNNSELTEIKTDPIETKPEIKPESLETKLENLLLNLTSPELDLNDSEISDLETKIDRLRRRLSIVAKGSPSIPTSTLPSLPRSSPDNFGLDSKV